MNRDSYLLFLALTLALVGAIIDIQQHRIPNWLTYPGMVLGFGLRTVLFGWKEGFLIGLKEGFLKGVGGWLLGGGVKSWIFGAIFDNSCGA